MKGLVGGRLLVGLWKLGWFKGRLLHRWGRACHGGGRFCIYTGELLLCWRERLKFCHGGWLLQCNTLPLGGFLPAKCLQLQTSQGRAYYITPATLLAAICPNDSTLHWKASTTFSVHVDSPGLTIQNIDLGVTRVNSLAEVFLEIFHPMYQKCLALILTLTRWTLWAS